MRQLTDQELEKLKPSEKHKWESRVIRVCEHSTFPSLTAQDYPEHHIMFQCLRCHAHYLLEECENCGGREFHTGPPGGVFCNRCGRGFTEWDCQCGTSNPSRNTLCLLEKQGVCFIATAIYGSYDAPEVRLLRLFRDTVLVQNASGRWLVRTYYIASPAIARTLSRHWGLRQLVRLTLVQPVVGMVRRRLERR